MRPLDKVIWAIKILTDKNFEQKDDFFRSMDSIAESYAYAAPEMKSMWWGRLCEDLESFLGEPDAKWKRDIGDLVADKRPYQNILEDCEHEMMPEKGCMVCDYWIHIHSSGGSPGLSQSGN